jgi:hypothetical protein
VPLRTWLAERLAHDYPGLKRWWGQPILATSLVKAGLVLPVLDGFDEIAEGLRPAAVAALNDVTGMPLVVTSRADEYAAAVAATGPLTGAEVTDLDDLSVIDVADYLPRTAGADASRADGRWQPVVHRLRARAGGADDSAVAVLGAALSTPLMVFLARTAYSDAADTDPA